MGNKVTQGHTKDLLPCFWHSNQVHTPRSFFFLRLIPPEAELSGGACVFLFMADGASSGYMEGTEYNSASSEKLSNTFRIILITIPNCTVQSQIRI